MTILDDTADFTTIANTGIARAVVSVLNTDGIASVEIGSEKLTKGAKTIDVKNALISVLGPLMPNNTIGELKGQTIAYKVTSDDNISVDYILTIK